MDARANRLTAIIVAATFMVLAAGAVTLAVDTGLFELGDGVITTGSGDILGSGAQVGPDWADLFEVISSAGGKSVVPRDTDHNGIPDAVEVWNGLTAEFLLDQLAKGGTDDTSFATSNKNNMLISQWEWGTGKVTPKDDISNAYAFAIMDDSFFPEHLVVFAGLERIKVEGDSHVDIELNQNKIGLDSAIPCPEGTCGFTGTKSDGDLLISMNFVQGGTLGDVEVRKWNTALSPAQFELIIQLPHDVLGSAEGCNIDGGFPPDSVCAVNNGVEIDGGPWPNYNDSAVEITNIAVNGFTEIGVDVTALLGYTPCLSTIQVKTRTAQSFNSQLKDFVLGQFDICGSLTLVKDSIPDDPQAFGYTVTGPDALEIGAVLDDYTSTVLPNMTTIYGLLDGAYTASENELPPGWVFENLTCFSTRGGSIVIDQDARLADIDLQFGEDVVCIYTNVKLGTITVRKETDPPTTGPEFPFRFSNDTTIDFTLIDLGEKTFPDLYPGIYNVSELDLPAGWDFMGVDISETAFENSTSVGKDVTVVLDPGEAAIVTYHNRARGSITLVKEAVPEENYFFNYSGVLGTVKVRDNGSDPNSVTYDELPPGTYDFTEMVPFNWALTSLVIDDPTADSAVDGATATVELGAGEHVTVTYSNTKMGRIVIDKVTLPSGDPQKFIVPTSWGNYSIADADPPKVSPWLPAGTYSVSEMLPPGWIFSGLSVTDPSGGTTTDDVNATVDLAAGETVYLTYTNIKLGNIRVVKDAVPNTASQFRFDGSFGQFNLVDNGGVNYRDFMGLTPGTYNVSEIMTATGYFLNNVAFSDANSYATGTEATIILDPGETVVVTFTNSIPLEGCTPGYWKNHPEMWPISTSTTFAEAFGQDPCVDGGAGMTLMQALNLGGGGAYAMTRHAAAAYLNSLRPEVDSYPAWWVVDTYVYACAHPEYIGAATRAFYLANELGCPCNDTSCD